MKIDKLLKAGAVGLMSLVLSSGMAFAETNITLNMYPEMTSNVIGVAGDYAPGHLQGSFSADGSGKTDMYFTPVMLFETDVKLGDIETMSYWTKKGTTHVVDPADWYLTIYTEPYDGDVSTPAWYGDRIGTEPYFSINMSDPANTWNQWTTDGSSNQLRFFESTQGAPGANFGSYTDPDWDTFVGGNALSSLPYEDHKVLYFSVQTGSAWADGFTGQLDGFKITLKDGSTATVNFEDFNRSAEITSPTVGQDVSGNVNFAAYLVDNDADSIQWAVRQGTCAAGTNTVFGNVDGHTDVAAIDQTNLAMQTFSFTGDMTSMTPGMYCFIYNPTEDSGESEIRKTVEFNLMPVLVGPPTDKNECKKDGWMTFNNPSFKNQGACVSYLQANDHAGKKN